MDDMFPVNPEFQQPEPVEMPGAAAIDPVENDFEIEASELSEEAQNSPGEQLGDPNQQLPRFQSGAAAGGWSYPYAKPEKMPKVKKQKGRGSKAVSRVIAVVLLICLSIAGGYVGANLENWFGKETAKPNKNSYSGGSADVLIGQRENVTIDVHQVDTSKEMTPAEVYAVNVNATVGITTSITTNYWGYPTTSAASGSGFVYSADGYIITNYHVIQDSSSITVSLYDGRSMDAKIVGYDESNDVAVLKIEAENLTPVIVGDSSNLNVGDPVVAIGNPLGELTFSLTSGAVSALAREVTFSDGMVMSLIQTDCAINSGNSGGALFNLHGEVIGITNAKYSGNSNSGASIDNIGFAIPINRARAIVDSIIEVGYIAKPYIGVTITDVSQETQSYGLPEGASVQSVEEGSPAEQAGVEMYDIITEINGKAITGASDLKMTVTESKPGDVLKIKLWRKGQTLELEILVGERIQSGTTEQESQSSSNRYYPYN